MPAPQLATPVAVAMDPTMVAMIEAIFHRQIQTERLHPGAALAVYRDGKLVLDLVGGLADTQTGAPVEPNTMFVLFSSTKPLASVSVWQQIERGLADLNDPVAKFWPEFAQNGKAPVTLRHVLTHRAGIPETPPELTPDTWQDWDRVVGALARATPIYEPGSVSAYHPLNHGWLCGEIVRRIDGRHFPRYLRDEITGPLSMDDTYVGLPAGLQPRVAKLHLMEDADELNRRTVATFNRTDVQRTVMPAANGIATARDLARFYAALALDGSLDGARILKPETICRALEIDADGYDPTLTADKRHGIGFFLGGRPVAENRFGFSSTARTFGHSGAGTSACWADADLKLGFAFIPNGFRHRASVGPRCQTLADAVRAACR